MNSIFHCQTSFFKFFITNFLGDSNTWALSEWIFSYWWYFKECWKMVPKPIKLPPLEKEINAGPYFRNSPSLRGKLINKRFNWSWIMFLEYNGFIQAKNINTFRCKVLPLFLKYIFKNHFIQIWMYVFESSIIYFTKSVQQKCFYECVPFGDKLALKEPRFSIIPV